MQPVSFLFKSISKKKAGKPGAERIAPRRYSFDFTEIPRHVRRVVETLTGDGYDAYLVGGCVRDALLDLHPKDFDVATNAKPDEIKQLFGKRAAIIGRRFRIVHVRAGGQVVEVATFRGGEERTEQRTEGGQIVTDNNFGAIHEDAVRRDLSINALFYDLANGEVVDYVDGYKDIEQCRIRLIGDPLQRFREDPVRMLRCVRFAAKLNTSLPPTLHQLIHRHAALLVNVSPSRMLGEFCKLNTHPSLERSITLCRETGLLAILFPGACQVLDSGGELARQGESLIQAALRNTDTRLRTNGRVSQFYLLGVMLWPLMRELLSEDARINQFLLGKTAQRALRDVHCMKIPKNFSSRMINVWGLQLRLQYPQARNLHWVLEHKDFRAAYDFLQLREGTGEVLGPRPSNWWGKIQQADKSERQAMIDTLPRLAGRKNQRGLLLNRSLFDPELQEQAQGKGHKRELNREPALV